jgi:hypothetical protein
MKGLALPEGRTPKACNHVIQKFKQEYYKKPGDSEAALDDMDDGDSSPNIPSSPVKRTPAKTPRKRKAAGEGKTPKKAKVQKQEQEQEQVDDDVMGEDCEVSI